MLAIVDYGSGNLHSVENALRHLGVQYRTTAFPQEIESAERVILPGVGNFGQMIKSIDDLNLRECLYKAATDGRPFLGICLGMQAMFESSEEASELPGLGILTGAVKKFQLDLAVPHMGWNEVVPADALVPAGWYTFANSYYVPVQKVTIATCHYGIPFSAALRVGNAIGVQFHPEKSGTAGLQLLKQFCEMPPC
ncbi:MAG: imidazole glycerol phosphate synthase subunit HisH [Fimbriimonadaceae bacterium]|nr:MAG: imidazole glycerol phosphate synthase subunit HisH [Fimbriimonadaceae bacterium]